MFSAYPANRFQYGGKTYKQLHNPGKRWKHSQAGSLLANNSAVIMAVQSPLGNMHNLKASLPGSTQSGADLGGVSRPAYNNVPFVVLPSGQTVPLSAFWSQKQNSSGDRAAQMPYIPTGMFPSFVGNTNFNAGTITSYNWPYGLQGDVSGLGPACSGSWGSEDNGQITPVVGLVGQSEIYNGCFQYMPPVSANMTQQYIAGSIQPMKCSDNKSYEMVDLDELIQREPPIPRAVPALWTNQEEVSLAKCLQNPEGITNIYIRGFMPDTTDEDLVRWGSRFGEIESCKAIIEQDTGKCKGCVL
jgi:RNA recognition motif. (a.k.a. RRM, RBD, or RNP domain)